MKSIRKRLFFKGFFALFLFLCFTANGAEALITLAWDAPTTNSDGSPLTDLAGYKIYYDTDVSGVPYNGTGITQGNSPITVPLSSLADPSNPEFDLSGLTVGITYYMVVTAYDTSNNESSYSNETTVTETDSDSDGLADSLEAIYGLDPNSTDSDQDGISDFVEFGSSSTPLDSDGDGIYDPLDRDSDNDGVADAVEGAGDADSDGTPDYRDSNDSDGPTGDQDGDGIINIDETTYGLNPNIADSDNDLIPDLEEWGVSSFPADTDGDGAIDALDTDSDNDGATDLEEASIDSDQDGIPDRLDSKTGTVATAQGEMSVVVNHVTAILAQTTFIENVTSSSGQPDVSFPYGGVEFQVAGITVGEAVLVTIIMPEALPANAEYWKYDENQGFQKLDSQVSGNEISFLITDGGVGDADGMANGLIVDPGYIGIPQSESAVGDTGGAGSSSNPATSGGGGGGGSGCSLSKGSGNAPDMFLLMLPLLWIMFIKARARLKKREL